MSAPSLQSWSQGVEDFMELECKQAGYSSVGRASDCRALQLSDGPWFDSGWPDLHWLFLSQDMFLISFLESPAGENFILHNAERFFTQPHRLLPRGCFRFGRPVATEHAG